jgi:membrane protein
MGTGTLVGQTFSRWNDHEGQRLGAALAFYSVLSAAPLVIFLLLAVSNFYGQQAVEQKIIYYAQTTAGEKAAQLAQTFLRSAKPTHGILAGVIGIITLLFGASAAFSELRDALNKIWDARPRKNGIIGIVTQRAFAFLLVIASGALLFASMILTTVVTVIGRVFSDLIPVPPIVLDIANFVISMAALTVVFALIYRYVPDLKLPWRVLWTGAAVSALLFVIGKGLLGIYLAKAGIGSAYGAAGSVIAIAFWIYYSAQIFLLGAEFTYVWSGRAQPREKNVSVSS